MTIHQSTTSPLHPSKCHPNIVLYLIEHKLKITHCASIILIGTLIVCLLSFHCTHISILFSKTIGKAFSLELTYLVMLSTFENFFLFDLVPGHLDDFLQ